jgi:hypothetical protein
MTVVASTTEKEIDLAGMKMPAFFLETPVEMNMAVPTTGRVRVGDAFARGTVLFTNKTENALTIPRDTRVAAPDDLAFATQEEAILPAGNGQQVQVAVQAVIAGTRGNVRANQITVIQGPLQARASVSNPGALGGGTDKDAQGVSSDDVSNLESLVAEAMKAHGIRVLSGQRANSEIYAYLDTARAFTDEQIFSHQVGEATPWLIVTARGRVKMLATNIEDLQQIAGHIINAPANEKKPEIMEGSFRIVQTSVKEVDEVTSELTLRAEMEVVDGLDQKQLLDNLRGRSVDSAKNYLEQLLPMRQAPEIDITPGWGFDISRFDWRIDLKVRAAPQSDIVEELNEESLQRGP